MQKGRDLSQDLDRLVAASGMFARQQTERATFGEDADYDDAKQDTHRVVTEVLDSLEKHLDEDFVEQLDRGEYPRLASAVGCWPRLPHWRSTWPYWNYNMYTRSVPAMRYRSATRRHDMLDEILEDFRADFEERLRKARREDRALSEQEVEDSLQALKEDLGVVVRRSRRKEDRKQEEEEHNGHGRRKARTQQ